MEDSRIFLKRYIKQAILKNSKLRVSGMNTDLLMIWLLIVSNQVVDLYGPAKITMVTYNLISLLKDTAPLDS